MKLCDYGCKNQALYQLKNGKWCCHESQNSCLNIRKKNRNSHNGQIGFWKDKNHSEKHKKRNSVSNKGRKRTIGMTGKQVSDYTKQKMSESKSGCNHPNWKGGISTEPYCEIWSDKEYKESIKQRDGYKCLNPFCSNKNKQLCTHHINYIKKDCKPKNLITLCQSCNVKANTDRNWHIGWYQAIMFRRYHIEEK